MLCWVISTKLCLIYNNQSNCCMYVCCMCAYTSDIQFAIGVSVGLIKLQSQFTSFSTDQQSMT